MYNNRHGAAGGSRGGGGGAGGNAFLEALEKIKEEHSNAQAQLATQRAEMDKLNMEKESLQRNYMIYYDMTCNMNMELQKSTEMAKRMTQLVQSLMQYLPPDQHGATMQAMERAKNISVAELQQLAAASQAQQQNMLGMLGMAAAAGPMGMGGAMGMGALAGPGGLNMAAIAAAMSGGMRPPQQPQHEERPAQSTSRQSSSRQRTSSPVEKKPKIEEDEDDEIDVQNDDPAGPTTNGKTGRDSAHSGISSSGASTPAAKNFMAVPPTMQQPRNPLSALDSSMQARMMMQGLMTPNGKAPYSYRNEGGMITPTTFPPDAMTDPAVPKSVKPIHDLPHGEVVCAVSISKDAKKVFTGGKGCVKIWDLASSNATQARARLECLEDNYIRSCKLYAEGTHLVVGGEAASILLFDIESQKEVARLDTNAQACYALALNQDSRMLYACCADGAVVIFDLTSMQEVARLPGHSDGASCVDLTGDGLRLWTGGLDNTLRSWDIRERKELSNLDFSSQIFSLGCSPTEDWVAVGLENNNIEVVNTLPNARDRYQLHRHDSCVLSLRYAHSGKWFCTTGKDNLLNVWRSPYGFLSVRASESSSVLSCDISHDDSVIVTGSGEKKATVYQVQYDQSV